MKNQISIGQYIPCNSLVHRVNPLVKLAALLCFIIAVFSVSAWTEYLLLFGYICVFFLCSKIPVVYFWQGIKPVFFVSGLTFLVNVLLIKGQTELLSFFGLEIYAEGLDIAGKLSARLSLLFAASMVLSLTTSPTALLKAIEKIICPFASRHINEMVMIMTIALRFIPTLFEEMHKIISAQKSRAADFDSRNPFKQAFSLLPVMIPLFLNSIRRSDELALAMECRGYSCETTRNKMQRLGFSGKDGALVLLLGGVILTSSFLHLIFKWGN
jgi:energy-coupling factor transport system permease protein